jgi:phosphoribosylformylglycinamidine synthase
LASLRAAVRAGGLATAHDISEGGLAVALAECCIVGGLGARLSLPSAWLGGAALDGIASSGGSDVLAGDAGGGPDASATAIERALFGEAPGGVIVAGPRATVEALQGATILGEVGGDALDVAGVLSLPVAELARVYETAIPAAYAE